MELFNEVKLDFSGAAALAASMRSAYQDTSRMRREIQLLQRDSQVVARNLTLARMPGLPNAAGTQVMRGTVSQQAGMTTAEKAALFGTAAGGSAFFFRATSLANPAAMGRFTMAVDDATAVVGQQMVPALEHATRLIRRFGDFLASHPTLTAGIGAGAFALTGLAAAGAVYQGLRFAGQGLMGIGRGIRSGLGYGGAEAAAAGGGGIAGEVAATAGTMAAAEGTRALLARRSVESYQAETRAQAAVDAARAAERASGGLGAAPEITQAGLAAEQELAAIRAARNVPTPPPLPMAARAGRFARLGGYAGRGLGLLGRVSEFAGPSLTVLSAASARTPEEFLGETDITGGATSTYRAFVGPQTREQFGGYYSLARGAGESLTGASSFKRAFGFSPNPFDWLRGEDKSSYGAAARPAEYQDVIGSFLSMRQSIASGSASTDIDNSTDATQNLTTAIQDLSRQIATLNGDSSDRGTRSR